MLASQSVPSALQELLAAARVEVAASRSATEITEIPTGRMLFCTIARFKLGTQTERREAER